MPEDIPMQQKPQAKTPQPPAYNAGVGDSAMYDATAEIQELEGLQNEINQLELSIEENGADFLANNLSEQEQDLFFDNPKEFFKQMMTKLNTFYNEQIGSKKGRMQELQGKIKEKETYANLDKAQKAFEETHKDISVEELMAYAQEELPPRVHREIAQMPPLDALNAIYEHYKKNSSEAQSLPKQAQGTELDAQSIDTKMSSDDYFNRV
ncbi:hypothetical protein [Helicobacter sp.]|uniref:hypothetical protein n=1 Tax=Helicobacter sp. TaxID=218 RepID=UPI002A74E43F|nr:hypothetical protein [Helicobacter sp.]MDY2585461.1 hypothetical protein [Helicobacter sp.]